MTNLSDEVVPAERWLRCNRCGSDNRPRFSQAGVHIKAECPSCGKYIKFVKQVKDHPEELEPELYREDLPW